MTLLNLKEQVDALCNQGMENKILLIADMNGPVPIEAIYFNTLSNRGPEYITLSIEVPPPANR